MQRTPTHMHTYRINAEARLQNETEIDWCAITTTHSLDSVTFVLTLFKAVLFNYYVSYLSDIILPVKSKIFYDVWNLHVIIWKYFHLQVKWLNIDCILIFHQCVFFSKPVNSVNSMNIHWIRVRIQVLCALSDFTHVQGFVPCPLFFSHNPRVATVQEWIPREKLCNAAVT